MQKILIIGHTGFLGSALTEHLGHAYQVHTANKSLLDLSKPIPATFEDFLANEKFSHIIICAAIADVEKCYRDQDLSFQVNVKGMKEFLNLAKKYEIFPAFFSSDYVFDHKEAPHTEVDIPSPQTVYGKQKLEIELYIQQTFRNYLIFRTSKLMSKTSHPKNILVPIIKNLNSQTVSNCFEDQLLNPVFVEDIALVIIKAITNNSTGLFHLGTKRFLSRYELGSLLATILKFDQSLIRATKMKEMTFSEKRPTNNMLNCQKIENALNFKFCELDDSAAEIFNIAKNL